MAKVSVVSPPATSSLEVLVEDYLASCRARGLALSTINQAYRYSLVDVFLPWCARANVTTTAQLDQRALDRFTGDLLNEPGKHGKPCRASPSTTTSARSASSSHGAGWRARRCPASPSSRASPSGWSRC